MTVQTVQTVFSSDRIASLAIFTISYESYLCILVFICFFFPFLLQLITREQFEDALKEIQDEGMIVVMGKNTIRIC